MAKEDKEKMMQQRKQEAQIRRRKKKKTNSSLAATTFKVQSLSSSLNCFFNEFFNQPSSNLINFDVLTNFPPLFQELYHLTGEVLGQGAYASVRTCKDVWTDKEFAVKIIDKVPGHSRY